MNKLIQDNVLNLKPKDLPEVFAQYQGKLNLAFTHQESRLEPAKILAALVIDENGNFLPMSEVIKIEPGLLIKQKDVYEQIINNIFKPEKFKFTPGHNKNGSKPKQSNLYINIIIQPETPK